MVLPRFSLRWLLLATTVFGLVSFAISGALQGRPWAVGVTAAVCGAAVLFVLFAAVFLVSQWFALLLRLSRGAERGASPFADAGRPLQIIPPTEPE